MPLALDGGREVLASVRDAAAVLLIIHGTVRVVQNYPHRAGIQYAVAGVLGSALTSLVSVVAAVPVLTRGPYRRATPRCGDQG